MSVYSIHSTQQPPRSNERIRALKAQHPHVKESPFQGGCHSITTWHGQNESTYRQRKKMARTLRDLELGKAGNSWNTY